MGSIPLPALGIKPPEQPDVLQKVAQVQQLKNAQIQGQLGQISLQEQKLALRDTQAMNAAMQQWDGQDLSQLPGLLIKNKASAKAVLGLKSQILEQKQKAATIAKDDSETGKNNTATLIQKHDQLAGAIGAVLQQPDQNLAPALQQAYPQVKANGMLTPEEDQAFAPLMSHLSQMPPADLRQQLGNMQKMFMGLKAQAEQAAAQNTAKAAAAQLPGQIAESTIKQNQAASGGGIPVDQRELSDYLKNPNLDKGIQKDAATFASWKAKQSPAALTLNNMLGGGGQGTALDQAAQRYSSTGELPAGFARSPGTTAAIIKRSAVLNPTANIAGNKATFSADSAALKKVQGTFDQMTAFEGTALKNLDLYVQKAKAVPDLGVKFANVPMRELTGNMIGTKAMSELSVARHVAATEAAKVLSSATGAGILSDTQQKEVLDIVNGNLPFNATVGVVETLKQDMANRHQSYQDDVDAIKGRLGIKPANQQQNAPPAAGGDFFSQFGGKAKQ